MKSKIKITPFYHFQDNLNSYLNLNVIYDI